MIREFAKKLVKYSGYELLGPARAYALQQSLIALIRDQNINLVLDVGANTGQFAEELREAGYRGRIISFEPLSAAHQALLKHAKRDPNWTIAERTAVGAVTGSVDIHIAGNSTSSSILEMLPSHLDAAPQSRYTGVEKVPVIRLDDVCALTAADRVLLKIDVQGYEKQVLEGAPQVLQSCRAVISEMSFFPLYGGQVLIKDVLGLLDSLGFDVWCIEPGHRVPETGRMLQVDGFFVRRAVSRVPPLGV
jgi:FkbM family methyltransferase